MKITSEDSSPYDFEVEIESGGRAYDDGSPAPQMPVTLSPVRAAARARAARRNIIIGVLALAAVAAFSAWFWFTNPQANIPDNAVARVNGEFIYQADVDKRLNFARFLNDVSNVLTNTVPSAASKLEEIISERMQIQDAQKAGVKVTDQDIDATMGQMETSTGLSSQAIQQKLGQYSLQMDDLRAYIANQVIIKDYIDQYVVAGATDTQTQQNRENTWLTNLEQTSKVERFKAAGSGPAPRVGSQAPEITLKDLSGNQVTLSSFKGKPVMVNFWATWCPPCRQEIPVIEQMYGDTHASAVASGTPYEILGVATQSDDSTIKAFTTEFDMKFTVLEDTASLTSSDYHVLPIPTSFFIDKDGIIRYIQTGPVDRPMMEKWLLGK